MVKNFLLELELKAEKISILTAFIQSNPDVRELQRALAIKMALQGESYGKITKLLGMHKSCITIWKQKFESLGLDGIQLGYRGSKSYLTSEQKAEVMTWLSTRGYWNIDELVPQGGIQNSKFKIQNEYGTSVSLILNGWFISAEVY